MRSSVPPLLTTTTRKVAFTIAGLCLLAGFIVFFQTKPNFPPAPRRSAPHAYPLAIKANPDEATGSVATDAAVSPPAIPLTDPSPSLALPDALVSQAAVEIVLPPPPSGDYELNLTAEQISVIVEKRYGEFFQSLGLPPEQLARLRSFLVERQQATVDAANAAVLSGVNPARELLTIRNAIGPVQDTIDTALRHELGEAVFTAYRDFDSTLCERNLVGDFSRLLVATGEPLPPEMEKQVIQLLKTFPGEDAPVDMDRAIFGGINTRARISEQAVAESAKVLSPLQLELLRLLQQHWAAEDARH